MIQKKSRASSNDSSVTDIADDNVDDAPKTLVVSNEEEQQWHSPQEDRRETHWVDKKKEHLIELQRQQDTANTKVQLVGVQVCKWPTQLI